MKKKINKDECACIEHNNGGEKVIIINDCPIHDELFGHNAKMKFVLEETNNECELLLDHKPNWAGDGYFCSKCMLEFVPKFFLSSERQRLREIIQGMTAGNRNLPIDDKWIKRGYQVALSDILKLLE